MIRTLFVLFFSICVCHADTVDKHTQQTSEYGDEGKFGGGDPGNTNALILWSGESPSIVRRHRPGGHSKLTPKAFKLWSEHGAGGFPVNLKNEDGFCSFLSKIDREPDLYACICDDTGAWDTGSASSCSPAVALPQCTPAQCEPGSTTPAQQPSCSVSDWSPETATVCAGEYFDQSRTLADCSIETQNARGTGPCNGCETPWRPDAALVCDTVRFYQTRVGPTCRNERQFVQGTKDCSQSCTPGDWLPLPDTVCDGIPFEQTRTYDDCSTANRQATGTKNCSNQCTATTWSPDPGTECSGQVFTQSRTLSDCTTETRSASGSKYCPPTCTATGWAPAASSICQGNSFEQSRTNSDCSSDTRTVTGTKNCQSCTFQNWTPSTSSVCSGDTFTQTRTLGNCTQETQSATGTKNCPQTCSTTTWSPSQSLYCTDDQFTQTRTLSNCTIETRTVYGTKHCPPPTCQYQTGSWTGPDAASICQGRTGTQSRTVTPTNQPCVGGTRPPASRTVSGTMDCSLPTCRWSTGPWTGDSPASICQGSTGSQSRTVTLINNPCEGGTAPASTQTVSGTRVCNPPCSYSTGSWSPSASNYCDDETFTQTRTVSSSPANCVPGNAPASTQQATGTKNCDITIPPDPPEPPPPSCTYWTTTQTSGGFMGVLCLPMKNCNGVTTPAGAAYPPPC